MDKKNRRLFQEGQTLVEMVIALAISGGLLLVLIQMMVSTIQLKKNSEVKNDIKNYFERLELTFGKQETCEKAIRKDQVLNTNIGSHSGLVFYRPETNTSTSSNDVLLKEGLEIGNFKVFSLKYTTLLKKTDAKWFDKTGVYCVNSNNECDIYETLLEAAVNPIGDSSGAFQESFSYPIQFAVDASNKIISCLGKEGVFRNLDNQTHFVKSICQSMATSSRTITCP